MMYNMLINKTYELKKLHHGTKLMFRKNKHHRWAISLTDFFGFEWFSDDHRSVFIPIDQWKMPFRVINVTCDDTHNKNEFMIRRLRFKSISVSTIRKSHKLWKIKTGEKILETRGEYHVLISCSHSFRLKIEIVLTMICYYLYCANPLNFLKFSSIGWKTATFS